jgi:predicted secreted Zn-dependent protease
LLRLLAFVLLVPGSAQALEKCIAPDGSVSYVDVCPPGTKHQPSKVDPQLIPKPSGTLPRKPAAAPAAPPASAKTARKPAAPVPADLRLQYYDVEGSSFARARNAASERATGPVETSWKLGYEYQVRQAPGRCALDSLATKLELVLTLPRWNPPAGIGEDEAELWQHYVDALRMREDPRFEHARAFERALPAELFAVPAAETCPALEAAMRARYEALRAQAQARFADHR